MKFTISSLLPLTVLARFSNATECQETRDSGFTECYIVLASGDRDIPGIYGGLWDNLKNFSDYGATQTHCGVDSTDMKREFVVGYGCNGGMTESAWWEATKNKYGNIICQEDAEY